MIELIITESAKKDIREALSYISNVLFNKKAASELADMIEEEISMLAQFPLSGTPVPDQFLADYGFRFLLIKNYKAYYIANKRTVTIIRFLHSSRDYENILKEIL